MQKNSQKQGTVVREQREKIQSVRKRDKRFKGEGGAEVLHKQRESQIEQWRHISGRSPRRKSQCYHKKEVGTQQRGSSKSESCQEF